MHKAKWPLKKGQILLNKAKFHFFEKSQKRAKLINIFDLIHWSGYPYSLGLEKCSMLMDEKFKF